MSLLPSLRPGGRHGVATTETRDPIGYLVAGLSRLAQADLLDRVGLRKHAEQAVFTITRTGFSTMTRASRTFARAGVAGRPGVRAPSSQVTGQFDITPTEDQQLLVDVVTEFATEVVRPAAGAADAACEAPPEVLRSALEIGLPILGLPEELGGVAEERSATTGTLVAEALARGDLGLAVATLAPGSVATAIGLWGTDEQQQTYLPAFSADVNQEQAPAAALALSEPQVLFDVLRPHTTATRTGDGYLLNGVKSSVPRGADAELFVVGALLDGAPVLFLVESSTPGLRVEADPAMGVRAASLTRLTLTEVQVGSDGVLGTTDGTTYAECVRLSRLAWCALAVGTGQAVLDYVTPYVTDREAFGEPIAHRQSVAFKVADLAIELQAMRLLTYKAAGRAAAGREFGQAVALAREACARHGMQIGLDGVQLLGGHGFVKEHPVERWYRDLRAVGVIEGAVLV
ncbi:MAG TPA: acyl-CoA dehydrogenase family protein [Nocardioides sp.]|uniref:acyl-CoA dehydrogenase family protein n=1 Tax=uncultured Nocardioides sp. TaxID=198441 RepID=UPI000EBB087F|nr:acyl-CoA dehydrogenase family protein [uncultured Nocardioides sp.]HCB04386.1 butyryl-CoA dehydrogenase [Nocardioides sp.]HRD61179.1 acyl-CoA dehydrogenase family protein [Nocardioides sp.]HRI96076.1 acyl-CoA dehydrogenase family protein [Nocardioides sp.]HRK46493.1 acyl-CoA dehydrogenase family protein [Nocardioides sp.]